MNKYYYYAIIVATMYVDIAHKKQNGKSYRRVLLRQNYREDGKVKHRTIANLSRCSEEEIKAIKLALKCKGDLTKLGSFQDNFHSKQGLSIGAIFLIKTLADRLHITNALGNSLSAKQALWQIMARIIEQGSRLSAVRLAQSHAVCDLLNLPGFSEDDLYNNLDWLCDNQEKIESQLFLKRYKNKTIPCLFLYDVTSSYLEGVENELGDWGYNRDGKKGKLQIVIGLLTDAEGVPVSVEVFKGNTNDTKTVLNQIKKLAKRFKVKEVTMVGDRGMIKSAQIENLKEENFNYITCITKPQIESLLKQKAIQIELFSEKLCEVENDGIRYILRKNPIRVQEIENARVEKIKKIEQVIEQQNNYLAEHKKAVVEVALRKIKKLIKRLKVSDFAEVENSERTLSLKIDQGKKEKAAKLDGCYVVKTELKKEAVSAATIHRRYKELALVEKGFRTMKTGLLETRPVFVRKERRTRGHVFIVMLAYSIIHELQNLWAELNLTVEEGIKELATIDSME
ncbi:MAG: IS1634 family transposase, partial [Colwellia sp.]|nr:IS1634 family transposase [Colwellia sp.]